MASGMKYVLEWERIDAIATNLETRISAVVRKVTFDAEAYMKDLTSKAGSGRIYGRHQASAPGEPPARQTGNLANRIQSGFEDAYHGYVSIEAEYAIYLEYGTVKMAARPFVAPTTEKMRTPFMEAMGQATHGL